MVTHALAMQRVPAACEVVPAWVRGARAHRAMIILRAPGCAWDRQPRRGCAHCGFRQLTTRGSALSTADLVAQVESALSGLDCDAESILEVDLYNSGNFLNDAEISPDAQSAIVVRIAKEEAVRVLLVESRPEYITAESLSRLATSMARSQPLALEIGIGLESADDRVREGYLRKGISRRAFERAVRRLREAGADLLTYVMLKAMPMSEEDALRDVVYTAEFVHEMAYKYSVRARIALQPTFVVSGTGLAVDFLAGRYVPPSMRLVVEAVRRLAPFGDLVVGLWDEGLQPLAVPGASGECRKCFLRSLQEFNRSQDTGCLRVVGCRCTGL
jgi:archaeosine synthase beta-subunit